MHIFCINQIYQPFILAKVRIGLINILPLQLQYIYQSYYIRVFAIFVIVLSERKDTRLSQFRLLNARDERLLHEEKPLQASCPAFSNLFMQVLYIILNFLLI